MTNDAAGTGHFHAVKFYDTPESLSRVVAKFIGEGLVEQQPALVMAMPEDLASILAALRNGYIDVDRATAQGDLVVVDGFDVLARVMVDGMPDAALFNTLATALIEQVLRGRQACTVRSYGGLVSHLWSTGNVAAALGVERLWNVLALAHPISLLCGYCLGKYDNAAHTAGIIEQHSHVLAPNAALWLTDGADCPGCGTPLPPGLRSDVVYRCQSCGAELIDYADAHEFVVHHLQAREIVANSRLSGKDEGH